MTPSLCFPILIWIVLPMPVILLALVSIHLQTLEFDSLKARVGNQTIELVDNVNSFMSSNFINDQLGVNISICNVGPHQVLDVESPTIVINQLCLFHFYVLGIILSRKPSACFIQIIAHLLFVFTSTIALCHGIFQRCIIITGKSSNDI